MNFLDDNDILSHFQHGFRSRRICETQLINTLRDFSNCLDKSSQVDAILLDFSKAFDKVDHSTLLQNIHNYDIQGNLLNWSASNLKDRTQRVIVDGALSDPCPVLSGTVLGPFSSLSILTTSTKDFLLALKSDSSRTTFSIAPLLTTLTPLHSKTT